MNFGLIATSALNELFKIAMTRKMYEESVKRMGRKVPTFVGKGRAGTKSTMQPADIMKKPPEVIRREARVKKTLRPPGSDDDIFTSARTVATQS